MDGPNLVIALAIRDDQVVRRIAKVIGSLCNDSNNVANWRCARADVETFSSLESLSAGLDKVFRDSTGNLAIVVSDALASGERFDLRAKELIDPHYHNPLVTLALTNAGEPIPDIDYVLPPSANVRELSAVVKLLVARLHYLSPPPKREYLNKFVVRRIAGEFELLCYYRLRHKVYTIMGYMAQKKQNVKSRLEIDGCDSDAIHLGAFEQCDGFQKLVGTARVVLAKDTNSKSSTWTHDLLETDRRLKVIVRNESLPLELPVFQSQRLNEHLRECLIHELLSAELSRVIVSRDYRGAGLSRLLVREAITEAETADVDRLYLECLPIHEPMYRRFGFKTVPGTGSQVIGVSRTMIAMMMELPYRAVDDSAAAAQCL